MDNLNNIFQYYGFEEFIFVAVVSDPDSYRVRIAIFNILGIPHSPCDHHNINLKVEDMHNNDRVLCELVEEVGRIGSSVRKFCKKSEILRQSTNVISVTTFKTRWTGLLVCFSRHLKYSPGLEAIAAE